MRKPSLLVIFLTVFVDLIGFGIVLPLLPVYSKDFGANGFVVGAIMASYSLMQFICAPMWGRLSDRVGRRPILLLSTAGAVGSYLLFAVASGMSGSTALALLLISRLFAGACGANITVAQAYIADITPAENRSKRMGLIGMAFGLGFIFGPALGGLSYKLFGIAGPGWVAAALCALNFLVAFSILPESRTPGSAPTPERPHLDQWTHTLSQPQIGLLVAVFFLATFAFTCFETTLPLLVERTMHLNLKEQDRDKIGYLFAYAGVIGALVQGGAIGRLVRRFGERCLIAFSMALFAVSLAVLPFVDTWGALLLALAGLSIGSSLTRPPLFGLISMLTPQHEQGATLGIAQSAGSLARIIGPIFAGTLFYQRPALPYLICAAIALLAALWTWQGLCRQPVRPLERESARA